MALLGAVFGAMILIGFRRTPVPDPPPRAALAETGLPPAYWAYWALVSAVISFEFCALFWAPAFLEQSVGLSRGAAAASAAVFSLGMLVGRVAASRLVRRFAPTQLLLAALSLAVAGFFVYWGSGWPAAAVFGLFLLGLGTAPLYPLSLSLAVSAAGIQRDAASARVTLAVGLAILFVPTALGALADEVGLHRAYLMLPGLVVAALVGLTVARTLQGTRLYWVRR